MKSPTCTVVYGQYPEHFTSIVLACLKVRTLCGAYGTDHARWPPAVPREMLLRVVQIFHGTHLFAEVTFGEALTLVEVYNMRARVDECGGTVPYELEQEVLARLWDVCVMQPMRNVPQPAFTSSTLQ
jgi:hypothetical protein